jgi:hypothetical protein
LLALFVLAAGVLVTVAASMAMARTSNRSADGRERNWWKYVFR